MLSRINYSSAQKSFASYRSIQVSKSVVWNAAYFVTAINIEQTAWVFTFKHLDPCLLALVVSPIQAAYR
jgi:hypothetical protein